MLCRYEGWVVVRTLLVPVSERSLYSMRSVIFNGLTSAETGGWEWCDWIGSLDNSTCILHPTRWKTPTNFPVAQFSAAHFSGYRFFPWSFPFSLFQTIILCCPFFCHLSFCCRIFRCPIFCCPFSRCRFFPCRFFQLHFFRCLCYLLPVSRTVTSLFSVFRGSHDLWPLWPWQRVTATFIIFYLVVELNS